jgi:3-hydroxyisobutyrate dehydrogenase-like beta-hydroxyacid dehydrogenase
MVQARRMTVAVIGTGAIGGAVVRRLLATGHGVTVWNRTPGRTADLVAAGARPAATVADAVRGATVALLCLADYDAVRACLTDAATVLRGRTVVVLCTGTPDDARDTARYVNGLGGRYLDAGVQSGPDLLGSDAATILYSGDRDAFERHHDTLATLSPPRYVGEAPDAAATWDLALFGVWYDAQLGVLRALDVVRRAGIDVSGFAATVGPQVGHVVAAVPDTVAEVVKRTYPAGPATLAEHLTVLRHLASQRSRSPLGDGGVSTVAARVEALIAAGRSREGLTATVHNGP